MSPPPPSTTATTKSTTKPTTPLTFYDIAMRPPLHLTACSPNPWKTRLTLNLSHLPYTTTWVSLPQIPCIRSSLGIPPTRHFANGAPLPTLPILLDPSTDTKLGDSFAIAVYLARTYLDAAGEEGELFPHPPPPGVLAYRYDTPTELLVPLSAQQQQEPGDEGLAAYARFNAQVDGAFSAHVSLCVGGLPLEESSAAAVKREFARRAGVRRFEELVVKGEERVGMVRSLGEMLGGLAGVFDADGDGPFVRGDKVCYADLVVGAWLRFLKVTLPREEWEVVRMCHGGVFGRLDEALGVYAEVK